MNDKTSKFFNDYAHDFSAIYGSGTGIIQRVISYLFRRSMRLRYQSTIEGCQPTQGKSVLDIGCGPGHYGIVLAKMGISEAIGIDFAPGMIKIAKENAIQKKVEEKCDFIAGDFLSYSFEKKFDYVILMGFMDYIAEPEKIIEKAISLSSSQVFFSFPSSSGFLAWQRRLRYKNKCDLYMYSRADLELLFSKYSNGGVKIKKIGRDYFVTVSV
ncbi:MAG: class I SAM-dependent methyltransferase [candidate division Zixibacteria bacterium]|nr:class I SAM-dependent methyltransferase [candidate division Zixibacteria bacterium]